VTSSFDFDFDFGLFVGDLGVGLQVGEVSDEPVIYVYGSCGTVMCMILLQITDPSSHQRECPTSRRNKVFVMQRNLKSGHLPQKGPDTKMNWLTDCRSQYNSASNSNLLMIIGLKHVVAITGVKRIVAFIVS
jgi:hypothetical protein